MTAPRSGGTGAGAGWTSRGAGGTGWTAGGTGAGAGPRSHGIAERALRLLARTVPAYSRPRYRDEWLSDLAFAGEFGIKQSSIVMGAARLCVTIDRADPHVTGIARGWTAHRRLRWGAFWLVIAGISAFTSVMVMEAHPALVVSPALLVGVWVSASAAHAMRQDAGWPALVWSTATVVSAVILAGTRWTAVAALTTLAVAAAVGVTLLIQWPRYEWRQPPASRAVRRRIGLVFVTLGSVFAIIGAANTFWWMPLLKVPGMSLSQIYAAVNAAGQLQLAWLITMTVMNVAFAVLVPIALLKWRSYTAYSVRQCVAYACSMGTVFCLTASGPQSDMNMSLADTFGITGIRTPWELALAVVGALAASGATYASLVPPALPEPQPLPREWSGPMVAA